MVSLLLIGIIRKCRLEMTFTQEGVYCIFFCLPALRSQDQEREKKEREGNKTNGRVIIGRHSDAIWRSFWCHLADFWQVTDHKKTRYDVVVFCWVILALGDSCGCKSIGCCCRCHRFHCFCWSCVVVVVNIVVVLWWDLTYFLRWHPWHHLSCFPGARSRFPRPSNSWGQSSTDLTELFLRRDALRKKERKKKEMIHLFVFFSSSCRKLNGKVNSAD